MGLLVLCLPQGERRPFKRQPRFLDAIGQKTFGVISETPTAVYSRSSSAAISLIGPLSKLSRGHRVRRARAASDASQYVEILTSTLFGAPMLHVWHAPSGRKIRASRLCGAARAEGYWLVLAPPRTCACRCRSPVFCTTVLTLLAHGGDGLDWSHRCTRRQRRRRGDTLVASGSPADQTVS